MTWEVRGDRAMFESLREGWEQALHEGRKERGEMEVAGEHIYAKSSPLKPKPGRRHALRRACLRIPLPRINEFDNLTWLRANGFRAPEPLVAAAHWSGSRAGLPHRPDFQALTTRFVRDATSLDRLLAQAELADEDAAQLGAEVARLHAAGFIHRDLFARNLLLGHDQGHDRRWIFLDAWRGGPRRGLRGALWDVACLLEDATAPLTTAAKTAFLDGYRSRGGVASDRSLARERDRVRRRYS